MLNRLPIDDWNANPIDAYLALLNLINVEVAIRIFRRFVPRPPR